MNSFLLSRSLGYNGPQALQRAETALLLHALSPAPRIRFDGGSGGDQAGAEQTATSAYDVAPAWAHRAGASCLVIDRFDGRYLLSGGADASIHLWDLDQAGSHLQNGMHKPVGSVTKGPQAHKFGITNLSFYPFDAGLFLSSSYDHALKVYDTNTLIPSASFDLASVVYSHSLSSIASHLLVACSTQHPAVRLVDLNSGSATHSLVGHAGPVLSVAWSPRDEHVLASGGSDGMVRLWDIRRSGGSLGVLDLEDSAGVLEGIRSGHGVPRKERGTAHVGACNGIAWTDSGEFLVSTGHDERVRVWDIATGANTLSHFGPTIRNSHLSTVLPLLVPAYVTAPGKQVMFFPNEREISMFDLFEGTLLKRIRAPGATTAQARSSTGTRNIRNRVTSLAWRHGHIEMYSAHSDGVLRAWLPRTEDDAEAEAGDIEANPANEEEEGRKRKRQALDEVYRELTKQKITFT